MKKVLAVTLILIAVTSVLVAAADVNPFIAKPKAEQAAWATESFVIQQRTELAENDLYNLRLFVSTKTLGIIWEVVHYDGPATDWLILKDAGVTRAQLYILSVFYNLTGDFR